MTRHLKLVPKPDGSESQGGGKTIPGSREVPDAVQDVLLMAWLTYCRGLRDTLSPRCTRCFESWQRCTCGTPKLQRVHRED